MPVLFDCYSMHLSIPQECGKIAGSQGQGGVAGVFAMWRAGRGVVKGVYLMNCLR